MESFYMVSFPKVNPSWHGEKEIIYASTLEELHAKIKKWGKDLKDYKPEVVA